MKLRKLLAVSLGLSLLCAAPVYANDADAVAVYEQMQAKSGEMNDVNAYYDYKITMSDGTDRTDMRLEMNMKANDLRNPKELKLNVYSRMTMGDEITYNMYYENGMYYMDMMGQKLKYAMPLDVIMKQAENMKNPTGAELEYLQDMKLRMEGEDRIVSFTMNMQNLNGLLEQALGIRGIQPSEAEGMGIQYRAVSGEYVVDPNGCCTKVRLTIDMDMTAADKTVTMTMDGDVGFANPDEPVEIQMPNLSEYQLMK